MRDLIEKRIEGGRRVQRREHSGIVDVLETIEPVGCMGESDSATAERVLALDVLVGQPHELLVTEQVECATDDEFVDRVAIAGNFDLSIAFVLRPVAVLDGIVDGQQIAIGVTGEPQLAGDGDGSRRPLKVTSRLHSRAVDPR